MPGILNGELKSTHIFSMLSERVNSLELIGIQGKVLEARRNLSSKIEKK